jgi:hypothetical protein
MATMFVTLQGKGGVGKSFLTAAFAQWLVDRRRPVACIDTDTLNPTLLQYKPLKATHLKLSQNHVIDPRALDALVGIVTAAPGGCPGGGGRGQQRVRDPDGLRGGERGLRPAGGTGPPGGGADGDRRRTGRGGDHQGDHGPAGGDGRAADPVAERASGTPGDSGPADHAGEVSARGPRPHPRDHPAAGPHQGDLSSTASAW